VFVFNNPFYVVRPAATTTTVIEARAWRDYSQPLPTPTTNVDGDDDDEEPSASPEADEAMARFDEARTAFAKEDFALALRYVDEAIDLLPSDAILHEFRALCLFAMGDYQEAAAGIYAVLAAGPGWNWETLASLYPNIETHTRQLRALEAHVRENPEDAAATFLLAYQYMTMGHIEAAVTMWERVSQLLPDDQLTAQLLEAFRPDVEDPAAPNLPP
jgi:tetratricopeptide (TPR) repeat protein